MTESPQIVLTYSAESGKKKSRKPHIEEIANMKYEIIIAPKLLAYATVGATMLGLKLDDALTRPIVKPTK